MKRYEFAIGLKAKGKPLTGIFGRKVEMVDYLMLCGIDGFTMYRTQGYWKGTPEPSIVLSVMHPDLTKRGATMIARDLAKLFEQEAVMVTVSDVDMALIGPDGKAL